jgi:hypothetical protein
MHGTQAMPLEATALATDSLTAYLISFYRQGHRLAFHEAHEFLNRLGLGPFGPSECARIERAAATRARMYILGDRFELEERARVASGRGSDLSWADDLPEPNDLLEQLEELEAKIDSLKSDLMLALALLPPGAVKSRLVEDYLGVPRQAQPATCTGLDQPLADTREGASSRCIRVGGMRPCA